MAEERPRKRKRNRIRKDREIKPGDKVHVCFSVPADADGKKKFHAWIEKGIQYEVIKTETATVIAPEAQPQGDGI